MHIFLRRDERSVTLVGPQIFALLKLKFSSEGVQMAQLLLESEWWSNSNGWSEPN